jgi:hypothetical protein
MFGGIIKTFIGGTLLNYYFGGFETILNSKSLYNLLRNYADIWARKSVQ